MKRDLDLIKRILEYLEGNDNTPVFIPEDAFPEEKEAVDYHLFICIDAGFVLQEHPHLGFFSRRLTWQGHDYLDMIRGDRDNGPG